MFLKFSKSSGVPKPHIFLILWIIIFSVLNINNILTDNKERYDISLLYNYKPPISIDVKKDIYNIFNENINIKINSSNHFLLIGPYGSPRHQYYEYDDDDKSFLVFDYHEYMKDYYLNS